MTNKYRSNSHLQGTNEGNKNKVEESKIICFVAFNQTLHNGFDYSGEEHAHTLGSHVSPSSPPSHCLPWHREKLRHLELKLGLACTALLPELEV